MKNIFRLLFVVFCLFTTTNPLHAQWIQTNGPYGGDISSFATSGTNLFAGTNGGGVFLSTDNGTSWTAASTGLTNTYVNALAVSGVNLFAGTDGGGVFLSTDNGTSWTAVNSGLTNTYVKSFAVSGTNLFAGTFGGGVFLSTNNGTSWTEVNTGLTSTYIYSLAISPDGAGGTNLFAGTDGAGVFLSTNNGTSWTAVNTGLTYNDKGVWCLGFSGTNLFAGICIDGVYRSTDNGASWTQVKNGLPDNTRVVSLGFSGNNIFAGTDGMGIFLSTNNGTSWTAVNTGLTSTYVNALDISGTNLFAGTAGGVFRSTNNGTSWTEFNSGLAKTSIKSFAVSGTNLFTGTVGGIFLSTNNGTSWSAVNTGLTNTYVYTLTISGTNLFAGTNGSGVFLSTDNGTSWTAASTGLTCTSVNALDVSGTSLFAGTAGGVFRSTNNGTSWTEVNTGLTSTYISSLAISPDGAGGTNLFAGTDGAGVFLSTNNGTSWIEVNTGLTNTFVNAIFVTGMNLFAGTNGGVFLSTDDGTSWTAVNSGLTNTSVKSFVVSGTNLFVGTNGGVFLTTSKGTSWSAVNDGLTNTRICALAVSDTYLFAGTGGGGIFKILLSLPPPTLSSPSNGAYLVGPPYTFRWQVVNDAGGYQIRIADNTLFTSPIINDQSISGSVTSYSTSTNLTEDQTYYWQMRTLDSSGTQWNVWSQYQSFVAIPGDGSHHNIHLNFEQEKVTSVFFNYSNGFLTGITENWSSTGNNFSSNIVLKNNESKSVNGSYTIALNTIDSTQVSVTLEPHNLFVSCIEGGSFFYGPYWHSNSQQDTITVNGSLWHYYKVGRIRERIGASVNEILPVELAFFNSTSDGKTVVLAWTTATEINNYGFEIERRTVDGLLCQWNKIGFVQGSGTSNAPNKYSFTDTKISTGRYAYRLKQVDNDGKFKYSQEVEVAIVIPKIFTLAQNYPNPFNLSTMIEFTLAEDGKISLKVFDILGREVATLVEEDRKAGVLYQVRFDASQFSTGIYFACLESAGKRQMRKLLLMK